MYFRLWVLFQSLDKTNTIRYDVYHYLILIAKRVDMVRSIFKDVKQLKEQFAATPLTNVQMQKLLRSLHDALVAGKHRYDKFLRLVYSLIKFPNHLSLYSDMAAKVMIELLGTYTEENASQAKEDAQRCIVTALGDPSTFLLDPLLSLKPIKALKGELIHELLTIFVSNKLSVYTKFYKGHKEFVNGLGEEFTILCSFRDYQLESILN